MILKGGEWKNTEDEILKTAVMKYGLNDWHRIASLFTRKTAKQCKARWFEWLDPKIRKSEWSREEDEKLLHLARLMPTQWRTIAPIIGRTANQCLERYQFLLEEAESKATGVEVKKSSDQSQIGGVLVNPESLPAKPDAVDMDDDEKEMLMEARARMANTQGKKARRKAREKVMEEQRRIGAIAKRRDQLSAGINAELDSRRKKGEIDWNKEIPFEVDVPVGLFDTEEESQKKFDPVLVPLSQLSKDKDKKEQVSKQVEDNKKFQNQLRIKEQNERIINQAEEDRQAKRQKLNLPKPQIGESELQELMKIGQDGSVMEVDEDQEQNPSRYLVADYSSQVINQKNEEFNKSIAAQEALDQYLMRSIQTPLLGGEHPVLNRDVEERSVISNSSKLQKLPAATPVIRDDFKLNNNEDDDKLSDYEDFTDAFEFQKTQLERIQKELDIGFKSLPAPKDDYEIIINDIEEDLSGPQDQTLVVKKQSIDSDLGLEKDRLNQQKLLLLEMRRVWTSSVIKLDLPVPRRIPTDLSQFGRYQMFIDSFKQILTEDIEGEDVPDYFLNLPSSVHADIKYIIDQKLAT